MYKSSSEEWVPGMEKNLQTSALSLITLKTISLLLCPPDCPVRQGFFFLMGFFLRINVQKCIKYIGIPRKLILLKYGYQNNFKA
jgi:hypothetical protein